MRPALLSASALLVALCGCGSCTPAPPPPAPTSPAGIYLQVVEAGCMMPDPVGGPAAFAEELDGAMPPPVWLRCMALGGDVASCGVPCGPPDAAGSRGAVGDGRAPEHPASST